MHNQYGLIKHLLNLYYVISIANVITGLVRRCARQLMKFKSLVNII